MSSKWDKYKKIHKHTHDSKKAESQRLRENFECDKRKIQARKQQDNIFRVQKEKNYRPSVLYSTKIRQNKDISQ